MCVGVCVRVRACVRARRFEEVHSCLGFVELRPCHASHCVSVYEHDCERCPVQGLPF